MLTQCKPTGSNGLETLRGEMDHLFGAFFESPFAVFTPSTAREDLTKQAAWAPLIDMTETKRHVIVNAEIPGVEAKDLDISITDDVLTISGEKEEIQDEETENVHRIERRYGSFVRRIALPGEVDTENIEARYKKGVLRIKLQKQVATQPKKIAVTVSDE